jgi:MoaA/NifB/PqqE/SkfB family radical SAM enzyme
MVKPRNIEGLPPTPGTTGEEGVTRFEKHERLHIDIGPFCNNNCIFCMEEDRDGRRERVGAVTPEHVNNILAANRFRKHVTFVSGEPTLCEHFLRYVRLARHHGFTTIAVISNGRRFSYLPFARAALARGLNHVILSIHGGTARLHDGLVRTRGAFDEALQGLHNLSSLRGDNKAAVTIHTSTVLNRRNCTDQALDDIVTVLSPHVDQMVFNIMQPFGRGLSHFDRLMFRYSEAAEILGRFFLRHAPRQLPIYLVDIPYCTTESCGIPGSARGFVERYVHYEVEQDSPLSTSGEAPAAEGGSPLRRQLLDQERSQEAAIPELSARHRDHQEQVQKARRPACDSCHYSEICDGVWKNYLERYGWDEFEPV